MGKTSGSKGKALLEGMIFLIDHHLKGHALVFLGAIARQGVLK
ncbi:hypothetical protein [Calothrix sp. NIES-2100]